MDGKSIIRELTESVSGGSSSVLDFGIVRISSVRFALWR
jgi:hypothetical protein